MKTVLMFCTLMLGAAQDLGSGCGETLCPVPGGDYAIALPEGVARLGVFVYLHGYAASARGAVNHAPLRDPVLARGMAFLALEGQVDPLQGKNFDWGADGYAWGRDDRAFIPEVIADAVSRFGLDARAGR